MPCRKNLAVIMTNGDVSKMSATPNKAFLPMPGMRGQRGLGVSEPVRLFEVAIIGLYR